MSKERFSQIIDDVYEKYTTKYMGYEDIPSKDLFLFEIKTNKDFSKKWGLKIEEKVLDLNERQSWFFENKRMFLNNEFCDEVESHKNFDYYNIPKKLITLTYNNEILESYE